MDKDKDILAEMKDMLGVDDWTEEERSDFLTKGGTLEEVEGIVELTFRESPMLPVGLSDKDKKKALLETLIDMLKDGFFDLTNLVETKVRLVKPEPPGPDAG